MADGPQRSEDLDYVEIFGNIMAYLEDKLSEDQIAAVVSMMDGAPLPESEGALDAVARQRAATGRGGYRQAAAARRMAQDQQDSREIAARFPGYASLKRR